jgi:glycosyltransferase involved in cell wall biosynthesis
MTPTSILFVDHSQSLGGAEESLLLLIRHLDATAWTTHLATNQGKLAERARQIGAVVHEIDLPRLQKSPRFMVDWLRGANSIARLAKQVRAPIIHSNASRSAVYAALASKLSGAKFVWHMRDFHLGESESKYRRIERLAKSALCRFASAIISNSNAVASALPCSTKVHVVHNGIVVDEIIHNGEDFRRQHGINLDAPVIGMLGRLRPWKGQDRFLRIAALLIKKFPQTIFLVVGGDPFGVQDEYADRLAKLSRELNLVERVHFVGQMIDPRPALAAMDIFVHPGDPEPFGLVNIEAMREGKPIVAYSHGALPEIVINGETGFLVEPFSEENMARMISKLIISKDLRIAFGLRGRARLRENFDIQLTASKIELLYRKLLTK